jgi:membrane associated rhomboid family serine protease
MTEKRRRRPPTPALPRLRRDEIPGIRGDSRPYATAALVLAGMIGTVLWRTSLGPDQLAVIGKPGSQWWRLLSAPFIYENTGYAFVTLGAIGLFGWLLERRHGRIPVLVLFAIGAVGGTAVTAAAYPVPIVLGANGAALALVIAWALPDLLALRAGEDIDGDLIGAGVIAALVALMPLVAHASWLSDAVGALAGLAFGWLLARPYRR